jgi:hypothetical protein
MASALAATGEAFGEGMSPQKPGLRSQDGATTEGGVTKAEL